jgi:large subunit ribosomal protein L29
MMTSEQLRAKTPEQLKKELEQLLREYFNMRVQRATQQLTRTHLFSQVKKNIARVKTIIREKELEG